MVTVALLAFVAALQIYGQARAERYKKLADARISGIGIAVRQQGSRISGIGIAVESIGSAVESIGSEVESIGSDLGRLTAYLTSEDETETDENV